MTENHEREGPDPTDDVAIIAMAGRFPLAPDVEAFWRNLVEGRECIRHFTRDEMVEAVGVPGAGGV
ncbi:MAG: beta-ketoacyl synthase N-terminal-like domain-containing protein [Gemmatimonadota bacterium]